MSSLFLPILPSTRDEKSVRTALTTALAMNGLQEEAQGPGTGLSDVDKNDNTLQSPLTIPASTSDTAGTPPPTEGVRDCNQARKLYSKGLALADNSEKEAQFYLRAIELCQDFFEAHNKLGEIYKSQGKYDLAIREFTKARRKWHYAAPIINLGEIYRMQGRYDLAETELIEAVRIRPDSHQALNQLKYIRKRLGEYDFFRETPRGVPTPTAIFTRIPGMTLPKGTWGNDLAYRYWEETASLSQDMIISGALPFRGERVPRKRYIHLWMADLRYGLADNFTIGLQPRFSYREAFYQGQWPHVSGLGDTNLLMKYHLWGRRRTHISLFHLLRIPTGDEDASDTINNVPIYGTGRGGRRIIGFHTVTYKIPLGSGAFGFTPGIALTMEKVPFTFHANASYRFSRSTRIADEFRCDLTTVFPKLHNFESMIEINYRWTEDIIGQTLSGDVFFREPGGHTLFLSPGIQIFLPKQYKMELGFQFPAIKPPEGALIETTIFHVGLTKLFF